MTFLFPLAVTVTVSRTDTLLSRRSSARLPRFRLRVTVRRALAGIVAVAFAKVTNFFRRLETLTLDFETRVAETLIGPPVFLLRTEKLVRPRLETTSRPETRSCTLFGFGRGGGGGGGGGVNSEPNPP